MRAFPVVLIILSVLEHQEYVGLCPSTLRLPCHLVFIMSEQVEDKAALLSCYLSCESRNKQLTSTFRGKSKLKTFLLYNLLGPKSFSAFKLQTCCHRNANGSRDKTNRSVEKCHLEYSAV